MIFQVTGSFSNIFLYKSMSFEAAIICCQCPGLFNYQYFVNTLFRTSLTPHFYGDELMKTNIALALISAIFLMTWITSFVSIIFSLMPFTTSNPAISGLLASGLLFIAIIGLLNVISFSGSVLFLLEARKTLSRWYLAAPLCISLAVFVITNIFVYFNGKTFLGEPISTVETIWLVVLVLLSPCSVLLFLSSYGHDSSTKIYVAVSSVASVFSIIFLILALIEISRWSSIEALLLPLAFYWTFLMPAIGVCFLSGATMYRKDDNTQDES